MKAQIEFGQFVEALVSAKGIVDRAATLEGEIVSMTKRRDSLLEECAALKKELDGLSGVLREQKEAINQDVADAKAAADNTLKHYKDMIELEKDALRPSVMQARAEADAAIKQAKQEMAEAKSQAAAAKEELAAIQADLDSARAAAMKFANLAGAGKA